jgi:hypothetical protein
MRTKLLGEVRLIGATPDCRDLEAHVTGVLNGEMAKAADALDCDKVTGFCWRVSQCAERRQAGAQQWRGIDR